MVNLSRKLYISILSLMLLFIVAGTVTFAWFKLNTNAWVSDLEIGANINANLKISVDGENYFTNLTSSQIAKSIVAKANGWELKCHDSNYKPIDNEGEDDDEDSLNYWYGYEKDSDKEKKKIRITNNSLNSYLSQISLKPVTSSDGKSFQTLDGTSRNVTAKYYIQFDIYFRSDDNEDQTVYFSNREIKISGEDTTIPKTELSVANYKDEFPKDIMVQFDTYDLSSGKLIHYNSKTEQATMDGVDVTDSFKKNFRTKISDAARFAVSTTGDSIDNGTRIYELSKGNGSYATNLVETGSTSTNSTYEGASGAAYDATKNAAFTYYNRTAELEHSQGNMSRNFITAIEYSDVPDTYKGFDSLEAARIINLNQSNSWGKNGEAKMTMTIWLEGWDADCIDTILDQKLKIDMSFTNFTSYLENGFVKLTYLTTNPSNKNEIVETKVRRECIANNVYIADDAPAYIKGSNASFKGWAYSNEDGQYTDKDGNLVSDPVMFDFETTPVISKKAATKKDDSNQAVENWYLVSVWA